MEEIWLPIHGYNNQYYVSNFGSIKSFKGDDNGKIMMPHITMYGYYRVTLSMDGKKKYYLVHRLVANAFLENKCNLPYINHIDANRLNPRVDNLEWCTASHNCKHAFKMGRLPVKSWLGKSGERHNKSKMVKCDTLDLTFGSTHEAARILGLGQGNIAQICRGGATHTMGFVFKYI